uniref:RRM domain-containing protein n=1 Tax=Pyrodinium bahamense TaxID=73915 RepID=A0A7S0FHT5_9DINO
MPPPDTYLHLVAQHFAVARKRTADKSAESSGFVASQQEELLVAGKELQWLPRWCLAPEVRPDNMSSGCTPEEVGSTGATLWLGDIPGDLATEKRVNEVLHCCRPPTMPTPVVRKVVRKGYLRPSGDATASWLGYAFVTFRDRKEAEEGYRVFSGLTTPGNWTIRVEWADEKHQGRINRGRKLGSRLPAGAHPPLGEQLFPASFHGTALASAIERHRAVVGLPLEPSHEGWVKAEIIKAHYRARPRREVFVRGREIPSSIHEPLLAELRQTRWPPAPQRSGMQAEQYLVLHVGKANDGFEALMGLLHGVLNWADPCFGCNRIAVTKDFQGSPHTDTSDVTYQYAVSLGSFSAGGELCVEGVQPDEVYVVDTHSRIARVDGRFIHWVRGHAGGDRYSLIFFSTTPACTTEPVAPFDASFLPHGATPKSNLGQDDFLAPAPPLSRSPLVSQVNDAGLAMMDLDKTACSNPAQSELVCVSPNLRANGHLRCTRITKSLEVT